MHSVLHFPGMALCVDHTKLTVSLLGEREKKQQQTAEWYVQLCQLCVHVNVFCL